MTDTPPAVALLFDDTELGGQLRDALHERGARIVHEGGVAGLSRELLQRVGADVLVVNLDDGADDALDQLYDVIDGDRPRVVFNDAQASRALAGWDRARWARHLAVKVLAMGDIDPPRPDDAREIQVAPAATVASDPLPAAMVDSEATADQDAPGVAVEPPVMSVMADEPAATAEVESPPDAPVAVDEAEAAFAPEGSFDLDLDAAAFSAGDDIDASTGGDPAAESEDLAAELEALLASGELPDEDGDEGAGPGLRFTGGEEPPPLHDGDFGVAEMREGERDADAGFADVPAPETPAATFPADRLQLSALTDPALATEPADAAEPVPPVAATPVSAPDSWALLDDEAAAPEDKPDPAAFGIEKLSAAEFLAPDVEAVSPELEPTMSLELVSMEEAVAPQAFVPDHEMVLDELGSALSRIVLMGAAVDGADSVCKFLEALPQGTRLTLLLTQHLGGQSDGELLERFAGHGPLPVRLADAGRRAGAGEVLMVPAGQQVRLRRDGSVELLVSDAPEPSIDASLTMAANAFGRDALAIVFAGQGNDAIAGSQAIHDRGGQVWVESSSGEHFADMVSGIFAERLVSFSGTPTELAARLIEVFP